MRFIIHRILMAFVYICVKMDNSGNLCAKQHVLNVWLKATRKLNAHSTGLWNMVTIDGCVHENVSKGMLYRLTRIEGYRNIWRSECYQIWRKGTSAPRRLIPLPIWVFFELFRPNKFLLFFEERVASEFQT